MSLPRKAKRLVEVLERIAADPASSENEIAMARREVERLLGRHGLRAAPAPAPTKSRRRRTRRLTAGEAAPAEGRTSRTRKRNKPGNQTANQTPEPMRVLPPVAIVDPEHEWAVVLGATLAEALGAQLLRCPGPTGLCLSFAGAGRDPELAQAAWRSLHAQAKGRSAAWCRGFAAAIDNRLDATIAEPAVRARVERVIAWLDADPLVGAGDGVPLLDVEDDECVPGADAGQAVAL
ncbi:MAG TPA: hypothetical protein VIY27_09035 [Myxococcota bacterium]